MDDSLAWIGVYIKSDNQALLNAIYNMAPHRFDSRLWDSNEYKLLKSVDTDGIDFVRLSLFFLNYNDRASFRASLNNINGFMHIALPGSELIMTKCYHRIPYKERQKDEIEYHEVIA